MFFLLRADHPGGTLILVDIGQAQASLLDPKNAELPTNLEAWWRRLWPFGDRSRVPTIPEILVRLMTLSRDGDGVRGQSDVYVRPPVELVDALDLLFAGGSR